MWGGGDKHLMEAGVDCMEMEEDMHFVWGDAGGYMHSMAHYATGISALSGERCTMWRGRYVLYGGRCTMQVEGIHSMGGVVLCGGKICTRWGRGGL